MKFKAGGLIDHVHLKSVHFEQACAFYQAIFDALGHAKEMHGGRAWMELAEFYLEEAEVGTPPGRIHLAFRARSRAQVDAFYEAGLQAGGVDNGPPGLRDYHPGYYAAYLLDPDGNNIEAKFDERTS